MTTVRDLFIKVLALKVQDEPWPKIREQLINWGHDIGHGQIIEVGSGSNYELTFETGEKISFDGTAYHYNKG
jgi:hypothetical protein